MKYLQQTYRRTALPLIRKQDRRSYNGKNEVATEIIVFWLLGQCYNEKAVTGRTAVEVTTGTKDENRINRKCPPRK